MKPRRLLLPMLAAVLIGAAAASTLAAASGLPLTPGAKHTRHVKLPARAKPRRHVNAALVRRLRTTTWRWQTVIGLRHVHSTVPLRPASNRAPIHIPRAFVRLEESSQYLHFSLLE